MKVDFIRFKASDGVELCGWLSNHAGNLAIIHIHGMSGNGYENYFLDNLREMFNKHQISFLTIDNRGSGVMNSFWVDGDGNAWGEGTKLGGSCFEIFEESEFDIQGAIDYLKNLGKTKFILMGHSLGGSKVASYLVNKNISEVVGVILLAPTDMVGWANIDPNNLNYIQKAKDLVAAGKVIELVSAECWLDKTPISAQTYSSICEAGSAVDIYGGQEPLLGKVDKPMLIVYGDIDIGITKIDGSIDKYLERVNRIKNQNTTIFVIKNASHSFRTYEKELVNAVEKFLNLIVNKL